MPDSHDLVCMRMPEGGHFLELIERRAFNDLHMARDETVASH